MADVAPVNVPPAEAIAYFRRKGYRISFAWQDVYAEEHARAFTVAKAMSVDILEDIRSAVDDAIAEGITFREFRRRLEATLQEKGWWGRKRMVDPLTGEEREVQLGSPRRLRTIYDVNLRTAHAAGHWEQIQRTKDRRPYLRYVAILDAATRPQHRAWHGTVLPADHPWWQTHYPPNGWHCRCSVQQLSERDLERFGYTVSDSPPDAGLTRTWANPRTGEVRRVPVGIDPGWDYNVGAAAWRGITPRELPEAMGALQGAVARDPLPPPREAPTTRLLPSGLGEDEYVRIFLAEFGARPACPVVFQDVIGEPLVISEDLFLTSSGALKVTKRGRERALLLLADAIKLPDEVWLAWREIGGRPRLRRRYIARWTVEGLVVPVISVFEYGADGWTGVTAFRPDTESYLEGQRRGTLLWRRGETE